MLAPMFNNKQTHPDSRQHFCNASLVILASIKATQLSRITRARFLFKSVAYTVMSAELLQACYKDRPLISASFSDTSAILSLVREDLFGKRQRLGITFAVSVSVIP